MNREKLNSVLDELNLSFRAFSRGIGIENTTNLYKKFRRGTLYERDIKKIIDYLGLTAEEVMEIFFED